MVPINRFIGQYRFLSNFWLCRVPVGNHFFSSLEAAYQAMKLPDGPNNRLFGEFVKMTPALAKRAGREIIHRPDWKSVRVDVMRDLLVVKFGNHNPNLIDRLIQTDPADLIEGNDWGDVFWGVCNGRGENNLGRLLMARRAELIAGRDHER